LRAAEWRALNWKEDEDRATPDRIIGALTQAGVKEEDAQLYAEGIRRGGTLVSARVPDGDRARYESVLNRSAVNLKERSAAYRKAGWNRFDPNAPPLSADQSRFISPSAVKSASHSAAVANFRQCSK
jgi:hypothetical protein